MENQFPEQPESLWRRKLSQPERAALQGKPGWELEAQLTDALAHLPDAPVPSNFSARVLNAVDLEAARESRSRSRRWNWHRLLPRLAAGTALLLFTGLGLQHFETTRHRGELARSLSVVARTESVPSIDALENLDVIQRMSQPAPADTELLADLDK